MWEANLTFRSEERDGIVPVGSYLSDAAGRLGIRPERKCLPFENVHFCRMSVVEGAGLLSPPTEHEKEFLSSEGEDGRLGCQTRITGPGDIVVLTMETKVESAEEKAEQAAKEYTKEFGELPLEKKIAQLVELEAIALGETMSFVINSPFLVFEKAIDVLAQFGLKKEQRDRSAARPAEHAVPGDNAADSQSGDEKAGAEEKQGADNTTGSNA